MGQAGASFEFTRAVFVAPGKKSARELRQEGSDYRCCIPALAGFVSPQSIAPDGKRIFSQELQRATPNSEAFAPQQTKQEANEVSRRADLP
jgi:hypothetical protein